MCRHLRYSDAVSLGVSDVHRYNIAGGLGFLDVCLRVFLRVAIL